MRFAIPRVLVLALLALLSFLPWSIVSQAAIVSAPSDLEFVESTFPSPARGAGARVLLVYSEAFTPYTLELTVETIALQLRRVAIRLDTRALHLVTTNDLDNAEYLVVFCPSPLATYPDFLADALNKTNRSVLWIGAAAPGLDQTPCVSGQFQWPPDQAGAHASQLLYRDRVWSVPRTHWRPATIPTHAAVHVLMALPAASNSPAQPVAWQSGHLTCFSSVPSHEMIRDLFADLLWDFFGVMRPPPTRALIRIEDYHPLSRHRAFLRMVDFLFDRRVPFAVAFTPAAEDSQTRLAHDLDDSPEFIAALRYAQQRGGRLVLRGCVRSPTEAGEFWDTSLDRPRPAPMTDYTREGINTACRQLIRHGLLPLAWSTPHDAASKEATAEIAKHFATALERLQLSDATYQIALAPSGLTRDAWGRQIIPENLGYVPVDSTEPVEQLLARSSWMAALRGTILGCSIHAYAPIDKLADLLDFLQSLQVPFLDLADLDHWVRWPGGMLVTGRAHFEDQVGQGPVRWRAYDRFGRLAGEAVAEMLFSGKQTFQRRGLGVIEVFESMEAKP